MGEPLSDDLASLRIDREGRGGRPPRGAGRATAIAAAVAAALGGAGWALYPRLRARVFKTEVALTEIALISPAQASITFSSTGYAVPQTMSRVAAKVQGRIARVHVREGDAVKRGQLLLELEDADLRSQIRAAESRVLVAKARVQTARANLAEVRQQAEREKRLADQGVAPKAGMEDLMARAKSLEEAARAAEAEVAAVQSEAATLRVNLEYTKIAAPIGGTVVSRPPEVGELVGPMLGGQGAVVEIADFSTLLVETDVPEARLGMVRPGAPCEIVLDAYADRRHRGRSVEIGKKVNRSKATVVVKVAFVDATADVLPDMSARVSFLTEELTPEAMKEPPKVVVPAAAVADRQGRKVVFAVEDDRVKLVPVALGARFGEGWIVSMGPPPGTKVVADPPAGMSDGRGVKQRNE